MPNQAHDPWNAAVYEIAEIGRWLSLKKSHVSRWLGRRTHCASCIDLIDLLFAKPFMDYGLSLRHLRAALSEISDLIGSDHFATKEFFTDGHGLFLRVHSFGTAILRLLSDGQWIATDEILRTAACIEFDSSSGLAVRWYPKGNNGLIVIDPCIAYGRPTIDGRAVATADVHASFEAEQRNIDSVCERFHLNSQEIEAAISFEEKLEQE